MTRKDYIRLADDLKVTFNHHLENDDQRKGFNEAYACIVDALIRNNPRFDSKRFGDAVFKTV